MEVFYESIDDVDFPERNELITRAKERDKLLEWTLEESKESNNEVEEEAFEEVSNMREVQRAMGENRYSYAIDLLDNIIQRHPSRVVAYENRGVAKDELGRHEEAIEDFNKALDLKPRSADIYVHRGISKKNLERYDDAIKDYQTAKKYEPDDLSAVYINIGVVKNNLEKHNEAIENYDKAIKIDPNWKIAYNNRGNAKKDLEQYNEAIEDYNKALELDSEYAMALRNRSIVYILNDEFKLAEKDAVEAKIHSNSIEGQAKGLLFELIAKILMDKDTSSTEHEYKMMCNKEFNISSEFDDIDSWIDKIDIDSSKQMHIESLMNRLREK